MTVTILLHIIGAIGWTALGYMFCSILTQNKLSEEYSDQCIREMAYHKRILELEHEVKELKDTLTRVVQGE